MLQASAVHDAVSENDEDEVQQWLTQVFQNKNRSDEDEEKLQQWVRQTFQDAGRSKCSPIAFAAVPCL